MDNVGVWLATVSEMVMEPIHLRMGGDSNL